MFSLSSSIDALSQWRAYGKYAIEFDKDALLQNLISCDPDVRLVECIYSDDEENRKAGRHVANAVKKISDEMATTDGKFGPIGHDALIQLVEEAATFKHQGFSEESESRIVMPARNLSDRKYRPKGDLLIPYIELDITLGCIKSIHIGPIQKQELACQSMEAFIFDLLSKEKKSGKLDTKHNIDIIPSSIPYRE